MRILVISDTHSNLSNLNTIIRHAGYDRIFHLGDSEDGSERIERICKAPVEIVRGNCDLFLALPEDIVLSVGGNTVFLTHGHRYGVKRDLYNLWEKAKSIGSGYVFYGHTHVPLITEKDGIVIANPGSLTYARDEKGPSYIVMDVDGQGKIHLSLNYVRDLD